ncbi:MAG: hypothetical protein NTZ52_00850 [Chlamydiae bacterium]|nr:hypothetical protein [Chlamydiota bacterium]
MKTLIQEDRRRHLIDMHINEVKKRLSPQTGFLHLFYEDPYGKTQNTIPILENMYYVLALFRTRLTDPILEARQLLDKILAFEVTGNFPIYIHQYPVCKDRSLSIHLLPVLHYLLRDYSAVLGEELLHRIEALSIRVIDRALAVQAVKKLSLSASMKLQAYTGCLIKQEPMSAVEWGDYLLSLHMMPANVWINDEIRRGMSLWNPMNEVLLPEGVAPIQDGFSPKASLCNLFMALHTEGSFHRPSFADLLMLSGSLVHPFDIPHCAPLFDARSFVIHKAIGSKQPLTLCWNELDVFRSIALKVPSMDIRLDETESSVSIRSVYPDEVPIAEDVNELCLYIDCQAKARLLVNGAPASTFRIEDLVQIQTEHKLFTLTFSLIEGQGQFFGHLSKSNRPSQVRKEVYEAYDWQIGLRTIRRDAHCVLGLGISCV